MDPETAALIKALGSLDSQDAAISFDVKTRKNGKYENVHVAIPAWFLALGGVTGLIVLDNLLEALTGRSILPNIDWGGLGWDFPVLGGLGAGLQTTFGTVEKEYTPSKNENKQAEMDAITAQFRDGNITYAKMVAMHKDVEKKYKAMG